MTNACPRCNLILSRESSRYCNHCGADLGNNPHSLNEDVLEINRSDTDQDDLITTAKRIMADSNDQKTPRGPEATLHILSRDGNVVERKLEQPETRIGKGPQNEIILTDPSVSTSHALVAYDNGGFVISDLGSRNGTFVNETKITEPRRLQHGDLIKMGHCSINFRVVSQPAAQATGTSPNQRTQILDPAAPPPPPAPPPAPKAAELNEDSLAKALVASGLVSQQVLDRVMGEAGKGRRLSRALIEDKVATETGMRDLMSRTFNIPLVEMKSAEVDPAAAVLLRYAFLRERIVCPLMSQGADQLTIAVGDPTDNATINEIEKRTGKKASLRLALPTEILSQLDSHFTPRLIGVLPTGEKIEAILNQTEIEIGKAPHNRLAISDPTVSSTHAVVLVRDGGYNIVDLGSSNGTFINGRRLTTEAHTLVHGDKIQLGQVVMTFRNPAETTENKTARLSLEALEEIRRRAGINSLAGGVVPTLPGSTPVPPASDSQPKPDKKEKKKDKEKDKEKDKKKKEDDRIKAALVNSTSRILSTVLGTALTVFVAYYVMRPTPPAPSTGGSGNPSETKLKSHISFAPTFSWASFGTGLFSRQTIEASGSAFAPGSNGVLIVDDGRTGEVLWMQLDDQGKQVGQLKPVPLGVNFKDPEAITYGNSYYYLVTSQSDPKDGAQNSIIRFDFNQETRAIRGQAEVISNLRTFLLSNVSEIALPGAPPGMQGGLNIEGLAWDPNNERLLLGLRSPLIGNQAVLIPLKLKDPRGPFKLENIKIDEPRVIYLPLEGHGLRDISYDTRLKNFLIVSGAPETSPKTDFGLWEWNGQNDSRPTKIMVLDAEKKPEGVSAVTINGRSYLFITGDSGSYLKLDYSDKDK